MALPYHSLLRRHVVEPWFPRTIDRDHGGFLCDFDHRWRPCGSHDKLLEFQARQTLAAAELLTAFPAEPAVAEAVSSGFAYLRDVMWDREHGGWHSLTDRAGTPIRPETKHSHGMAYAIQACLAVHAITDDPHALDLAREGLRWIDHYAYDDMHGGYFGPLGRDGKRLGADPFGRAAVDPIGTPYGLKDMNVNSDFYELLLQARLACGADGMIDRRLDELRAIIVERYAVGGGPAWHHYATDWTPGGRECRPATAAQTASRLLEDPFASDPTTVRSHARSLLLWAFEFGWDARRGGLHFTLEWGERRRDPRTLEWWGQFELWRAADYLARLDPSDGQIGQIRDCAEEAVLTRVLDESWLGSRQAMRPKSWPSAWIRGLRLGAKEPRKASRWKDASHDARTLLRLMWLEDGTRPTGMTGPDWKPGAGGLA